MRQSYGSANGRGAQRQPGRQHRRFAVLVAAAVLGAGCAGDVGKYRDVATGAQGLDAGELSADDGQLPDDETALTGPEGLDGALGIGGSGPAAGGRTAAGSSGATAGGSGGTASSGPYRGDVGVTRDSILIANFTPESGPGAQIAANSKRAFQAGVNEVNEMGGVHGRKLVVKTYDDAAGPAGIQANAKVAADDDKVFMLMSVLNVDAAILTQFGDQRKIPVVTGNIAESIGRPSTWSFSMFPYWAHQARALMPSYMANSLGGKAKKIGVVYENTENATETSKVFKSAAEAAGLSVVIMQPVDVNPSTCLNEVSNLQAAGAQIVLMLATPLVAICMLRDARSVGYTPIFTGLTSSWGFNVVNTASGRATDGMTVFGTGGTLDTPAGQRYATAMRKHYPNTGAESDDIGIPAFGAAQYIAEALRRAGPNLTRERLRHVLEQEMAGFSTGYGPPCVTARPGDHRGPDAVTLSKAVNGVWTTPDANYRASF